MLTQAAVGLPFCRFESHQPRTVPGPWVPSPGRCSIAVTKPPGLHTRALTKPRLAAMPQGRRRVVCAQGVNIWAACKVLEESDKTSGGTRLLTTGQLEGQQARGRHTQEFTPLAPAALGMVRTKRLQTVCKVLPLRRGLQGVCLHTRCFLSPFTEKNTMAFNPEINSWQVGSPEFNTCSHFAVGSF